jgi:type IV pilus assembly protein PilY1
MCNPRNGHDQVLADVLFQYAGGEAENEMPYNVRLRKTDLQTCDPSRYNSVYDPVAVTTLNHVRTFDVKVQRKTENEPNDFLNGNIAGVLQRLSSRARFGLELFNNGWGAEWSIDERGQWIQRSKRHDGGKVHRSVGSDIGQLVGSIEDMQIKSDTRTPLAEAFYEGVRYFRQESPPAYAADDYVVDQANDPYYFSAVGDYVPCANSFVLFITDGESTFDWNVPGAVIFGTYPIYVGPPAPPVADYDDDPEPGFTYSWTSDFLDDVALWAHTNDMRDDLEGTQGITLYTIFGFGSESQGLKDAARNGGFVDRNGNGLPDLDEEWDADGDGEPDTYFEAPDGNQLETQILAALTGILQDTASGTAVSVLATSASGEGALFQSFFKPAVFDGVREVNWLGYLQALWVDPFGNLREDTDGNSRLTFTSDKIILFGADPVTGNTVIQRFADSDGDGKADASEGSAPLDDINSLWEGGEKLALRDPRTRTIKTFVDLDEDRVVGPGELIDFDRGNADILRPFLRAATEEEAEKIIRFIRGEEVAGYRDRTVSVGGTDKVWPLGDIVYSTPTVVGKPLDDYSSIYGDRSYDEFFRKWRSRGVTVYSGANDGMLHAFKAGTFTSGDDPATATTTEQGWYSATEDPVTPGDLGSERWAYIPYNLLPHLKWLTAADEAYTHTSYVDQRSKVADVRIFTDEAGAPIDDDHTGGWGTILIGGMRFGGKEIIVGPDDFGTGVETRTFRSAYFAVDITVPGSPRFLWEFTHEDLALTTSYPSIGRVDPDPNTDGDEKWFAVIGSGPTDYNGTSNQTASLFVLDLKTGQPEEIFLATDNNAFMASPITVDVRLNYSVDVAYIGETYLDGATWKGKVFRLQTKDCVGAQCTDPAVWTYQEDPANWTFSTLFSADQPITSPPNASLDSRRDLWVFVGTGRFLNEVDKADTTLQYFYGLKDECYPGQCAAEVDQGNLFDATNVRVFAGGTVEGAPETQFNNLISYVRGLDGWYTSLSTGGERVLSKPSVLGGITLFTSFRPNNDICGFGGSGKLYATYFETGTAFKESVIGTEMVGEREEVVRAVDLGAGLPSSLGIHVGKQEGGTGFIQESTGLIQQMYINPALGIKSGPVFWTLGEGNAVCTLKSVR